MFFEMKGSLEKYLNVELVLISEIMNSEIKDNYFKHIFKEAIHISEFTNSEIRITVTFRSFCQANRLP